MVEPFKLVPQAIDVTHADRFAFVGFALSDNIEPVVLCLMGNRVDDGAPVVRAFVVMTLNDAHEMAASLRRSLREAKSAS